MAEVWRRLNVAEYDIKKMANERNGIQTAINVHTKMLNGEFAANGSFIDGLVQRVKWLEMQPGQPCANCGMKRPKEIR